jgi:cyanophycinase
MLALVGSGEYLSPIEPLDRELINRLTAPVRVVCLPTAAGTEGPERIDYWSRLGVEHFARLGVTVTALPVIDAASANDPKLAQAVSEANFVYLSGGKPDYLHKTLDGSLVWQAIQTVEANGGVLAGCSAGAMIMGEKMLGFRSNAWNEGFNLIPGVIVVPHYDEFKLAEPMMGLIRQLFARDITMLGIEGYTALVKTGTQYEVLGSGGVTIWNKLGKTRFTAGALPANLLA